MSAAPAATCSPRLCHRLVGVDRIDSPIASAKNFRRPFSTSIVCGVVVRPICCLSIITPPSMLRLLALSTSKAPVPAVLRGAASRLGGSKSRQPHAFTFVYGDCYGIRKSGHSDAENVRYRFARRSSRRNRTTSAITGTVAQRAAVLSQVLSGLLNRVVADLSSVAVIRR